MSDDERREADELRREGAIAPLAGNPLGFRPAMNRIDDDSFGNGALAGLKGLDRSLGERFIAGDEDGLVGVGVAVPRQVFHGSANHRATIFLTPVGSEPEQLLADFIEVAAQRLDAANPMAFGVKPAVAVFIKRHFQMRRPAVLAGGDEGVDDFPQLGFRLFDETLHAAARIQQNGELHLGFGGFRTRRCGRVLGG